MSDSKSTPPVSASPEGPDAPSSPNGASGERVGSRTSTKDAKSPASKAGAASGIDAKLDDAEPRPNDRDAKPSDAKPDRDAKPSDAEPSDRDAKPSDAKLSDAMPSSAKLNDSDAKPNDSGARPHDHDAKPSSAELSAGAAPGDPLSRLDEAISELSKDKSATTPATAVSNQRSTSGPAGESEPAIGLRPAEHETLELEEDPLLDVVLHDTYRISRVIGEGGMGRVYEAWHTRISKKRYAIKVLHAEYARNAGILKRFQREAETAACLSHPNAVGVYDVDVVPDGQERPYLVSEYLEGSDLSKWIKQHAPLDEGFVKHIALQICSALVEAHGRGVVHRDLKPQNIFLLTDPDGEIPVRPVAKVLDFGLSRFLDDADSELTRSGMVMGTPSYMSPEQARGERADHRVDIYGLGAVMFASVTGRPPYKSSSPQATVLSVMNDEAPRPSKLNPNVSPDLELIIQKAMAREPVRRYATMEEFKRDLEALVVDEPASGPLRPTLDSLFPKRQEYPSLRTQLLGFWTLAMLASVGAAVAAVWGAALLRYGQWPLSGNLTFWLSMVVLAGFAAPLHSFFRKVRSRVWSNTARVAQTLQSTRQITLAALATYGLMALTLVLINLFQPLAYQTELLRRGALGTFAGIALVCFCAAFCAAAAVAWRQYLQAPGGWVETSHTDRQDRLRRLAAGPAISIAAIVCSLAAVAGGALWTPEPIRGAAVTPRVHSVSEPSPAAAPALRQHGATLGILPSRLPDAPPLADARAPAVMADAGPSAAADAGRSETTLDLGLASAEALSAAMSQGRDQLVALLEQYPNDPGVLRAVALEQASTSPGLEDSIATFKRLFAVSPQDATNDDVQQIIMAIARGNSSARVKAFELMAHNMGYVGPDLLYKLSLSERATRTALGYLARPSVRRRFSPALAVAYDLQFSPRCSARIALLPRAEQFGDERTLRILKSLSATPTSGCGTKKNKPCRAKCASQAEAFSKTADAIADRLQRTVPTAATD